jgi:nucleotide-binding universal stress UspA family protein
METVLVPLDFSDATPKVADVAARFAAELKARMVLLHVVEPIAEYVPVAAPMDILTGPAPALQALDPHPLIERLERLAEPFRQKNGLAVVCEVQVGLAVDEILTRAQLYECAMIILGSHGHGALYHLFGGGVATGVLKRTQFPVLIVPVRKEKKE